ncbi:hypothetical protein VB711_20750 [Cronbergia sp. UHCC 0137]|uniref:hypothetical protein n=1 Tax=Cronbergia sp. UHCC 0137 TaxID=3110239 RepID=UPI002B211F98|nr:hypothetical protein [Cronbergia sp. UHCC 0137]MEA5620257.1 hypothetical protein [Cronbergia sp. UHCC 0137]
MNYACLIKWGHLGWRFLRYKFSPWLILAIAPLRLLLLSGSQRTHEHIRYMRLLWKIDFVGVYRLVNDLLW